MRPCLGGPEKVFTPGPEPALRGPDGSKPFPKLNLLVARRTLLFDDTEGHILRNSPHWLRCDSQWTLRITCREDLRLIEPTLSEWRGHHQSWKVGRSADLATRLQIILSWRDAYICVCEMLDRDTERQMKWDYESRVGMVGVRWTIVCTPRVGVGECRRGEKITTSMRSATLTQFLSYSHTPATHSPCVGCMCKSVTTLWLYSGVPFNPLALELDIYSLARHLCKTWIFYEPRRGTLGNTRHFVEE